MLQYFETLQDQSGNALSLDGVATCIVTRHLTGLAANIYSTNSTASPIAASTVTADITGQISFFAPDDDYILTYQLNGVTYKTKVGVQMLDPMSFVPILETGAANAYVITDVRLCLSLIVGEKIMMQVGAGHTSTGASTLNMNGTGPQPITTKQLAAITTQLVAGGMFPLTWDGTEWQASTS
jgi:hypothetical protein